MTQRMGRAMNRGEVRDRDGAIALRRRHAPVAQQHMDGAHIGAAVEKREIAGRNYYFGILVHVPVVDDAPQPPSGPDDYV